VKAREVRQKCFRDLSAIVHLRRLTGETLPQFLHRAMAQLQAVLLTFPANMAQYIKSYYLERLGKEICNLIILFSS
jgi:hypothetical protein